MRSRAVIVATLALAAAACGTPDTPAPTQKTAGAEALRAFEQRDCVAAAPLLREAVVQTTDVKLHYALAVCASHLDIRQEAITHFKWVLAHAAADSAEAKVAREWLTAVGVIRQEEQPAASVAETPADPEVGRSTVRGQIVEAEGSVSRVQLFLRGRPGTPTANFQYVVRTRDDGRFQFQAIPAGTYKLSDKIVGKPAWRLRVDVPPSGEVEVALTAADRFPDRDDFPDDGT